MEEAYAQNAERETNAERAGTKTDTDFHGREALEIEQALLAYAATVGSVVYFILSGRFVKIGTSRDLRHRLGVVRVAAPEQARLIGVIEGGADVEKKIHEKLKHLRHRREWYYFHEDVVRTLNWKRAWYHKAGS